MFGYEPTCRHTLVSEKSVSTFVKTSVETTSVINLPIKNKEGNEKNALTDY